MPSRDSYGDGRLLGSLRSHFTFCKLKFSNPLILIEVLQLLLNQRLNRGTLLNQLMRSVENWMGLCLPLLVLTNLGLKLT